MASPPVPRKNSAPKGPWLSESVPLPFPLLTRVFARSFARELAAGQSPDLELGSLPDARRADGAESPGYRTPRAEAGSDVETAPRITRPDSRRGRRPRL